MAAISAGLLSESVSKHKEEEKHLLSLFTSGGFICRHNSIFLSSKKTFGDDGAGLGRNEFFLRNFSPRHASSFLYFSLLVIQEAGG